MIDHGRSKQIAAEVENLLAKLPERRLPVNVKELAGLLGILVEPADFGGEVSGVLVRTDTAAMIGVNWTHHPNRQRFTIAHEIGPHQLHKGGTFADKGTTARFRGHSSGSGTAQEEQEANLFAAMLLMPEDEVRKAAKEQPFAIEDEDELRAFADKFGVSAQAMLIRLRETGLVEF
jgi:Zn-dependent peptidase ImmA (M78 family)